MEHLKTVKIILNGQQFDDLLLLASERGYHLDESGEHLQRTGRGVISPEMTVSQYVEEVVTSHLSEFRAPLVPETRERRVKSLKELRDLWQSSKRKQGKGRE